MKKKKEEFTLMALLIIVLIGLIIGFFFGSCAPASYLTYRNDYEIHSNMVMQVMEFKEYEHCVKDSVPIYIHSYYSNYEKKFVELYSYDSIPLGYKNLKSIGYCKTNLEDPPNFEGFFKHLEAIYLSHSENE